MIPRAQEFSAVRRPKMPIFTLALLFISSMNQLSPVKIWITQIKGVVSMQIRHDIKFHASGDRRLIYVTVAFITRVYV